MGPRREQVYVDNAWFCVTLIELSKVTLAHLVDLYKNWLESAWRISYSGQVSWSISLLRNCGAKLLHTVERPLAITHTHCSTQYDGSMVCHIILLIISLLNLGPSEQSEQTLGHLEFYNTGLHRQLHLVLANGHYPTARPDLLMTILTHCLIVVSCPGALNYVIIVQRIIRSLLASRKRTSRRTTMP